MFQIETRKKKKFKTDLAPLIDVVFLLLIFFMLTFATPGQGMDVNLPNGIAPSSVPEKISKLSIHKDGTLRLNDDVVNLEELAEKLKTEFQGKTNKSIEIEADPETPYDLFARALDIARQSGAKDFSIIM
jgi:biopolymer transport protein ExbD